MARTPVNWDPNRYGSVKHVLKFDATTGTYSLQEQEQSSMAAMGGVPPGASPTDPTGNGGGNIGTGNIPMPGEAGFASPITTPRTSKQEQ